MPPSGTATPLSCLTPARFGVSVSGVVHGRASRSRSRLGAGGRAIAQAATADFSGVWGRPGGTRERVLRYPDGRERRILYPVIDEKESCEETCDTCFDETWELDHPWDIPGIDGMSNSSREARQHSATRGIASTSARNSKVSELPASPAALLQFLQSDEYKRAQEETWTRVRDSYEVLSGCPWVLPKPLYVLATRRQQGASAADASHGQTYTLRTRVPRSDLEEGFTTLLQRTRPDGSAVIRCEEVLDGVVAFESDADAQRFAAMLEADGHEPAPLMQADSHKLFRSAADVRNVVVLMRAGASVPLPEVLAASLRGQRPVDDL